MTLQALDEESGEEASSVATEILDLGVHQVRVALRYYAAFPECAGSAREHHGLVVIPPARFPSSDFFRLAKPLAALLGGPEFGGSFVVWLREVG